MTKLAPPINTDGYIVVDKRVSLLTAIAIAGYLVYAGMSYASVNGRIEQLEKDKPLIKELNDRSIRMEVELKFIRQAVDPRTPR